MDIFATLIAPAGLPLYRKTKAKKSFAPAGVVLNVSIQTGFTNLAAAHCSYLLFDTYRCIWVQEGLLYYKANTPTGVFMNVNLIPSYIIYLFS